MLNPISFKNRQIYYIRFILEYDFTYLTVDNVKLGLLYLSWRIQVLRKVEGHKPDIASTIYQY